LFKRGRSAYSLTTRGEQIVRLAERMETEVAAFERSLHGRANERTPMVTDVVPLDEVTSLSGLAFLKDMIDGKLPQPPMCATPGFHLAEATEGYAAFEGLPEFRIAS
jgi:hypothetical protein